MNNLQRILLIAFGVVTAICLWKSDGLQETDMLTIWGGAAAIWLTVHIALNRKTS